MLMTRERLTEVVREAARLQRRGHFIESIKYFRTAAGCGLIDAKRAADLLRNWLNRPARRVLP